jgi:hypothetical protein
MPDVFSDKPRHRWIETYFYDNRITFTQIPAILEEVFDKTLLDLTFPYDLNHSSQTPKFFFPYNFTPIYNL